MPSRVSDATTAWTQQILSAESLREVVSVCDAERIDVLPVKGVITGHLLYADLAERPLLDVDVRVRPEALMPLLDAGRRAGWGVIRVSRAYRNIVFDVGGRMVDVEAGVGPPGLCGLTVASMLARSTRAESLGFSHRVPELHDHALLLCVNAFKDKLVGAAAHAIEDLERLVAAPGFDAARLAALARESGVRSLVWIVADWLARDRGAVGWRAVRTAMGERSPRPMYAALFRRLATPERMAGLPLRLLARIAADSPSRRIEALVAVAAFELEARLADRASHAVDAARSRGKD